MHSSLERLRQRRAEGNESGFTLIELLIVIVILGILAAIVVFAVENLAGSASQASCGSDYKTVETAVEAYKAELGVYPGGTVSTSYTYAAGPTPSSSYPAAGDAAMEELMGTYTPGTGSVVGPFLKDVPLNPGHYSITVANDNSGTISVQNGSGSTATCATVS